MSTLRIVIVGAGIGGLAAAVDLARRGCAVTVVERADSVGGKARRVEVAGRAVDAGPTVFTMRTIFESLFEDAGARLDDALALRPAAVLARHAWRQGGQLDLHADIEAAADAIGALAGPADAAGFREFCRRSAEIFRTLERTYIANQRPSPVDLMRRAGPGGIGAMLATSPFTTLWKALARHFRDPRLRQLFGRYATYCGSSPMAAPATLMLVAHVEQSGVWLVEGGIHAVARAVAALAERHGASIRLGADVERIVVNKRRAAGVALRDGERIAADAVVFNGDVSALGTGLLGEGVRDAAPATARADRSLSAITWCLVARTSGFPLVHHNVFFGEDYEAEFDAIFRGRTITEAPTVYVCAEDRGAGAQPSIGGPERLLALINAPADGDRGFPDEDALARHQMSAFRLMAECGLVIEPDGPAGVVTTPRDFEALFPGTGGALYGRANHGAFASFARPGAASRLPGLYLAGGSAHPGPGVPMAAMSGRLAAARLLEDLASDA